MFLSVFYACCQRTENRPGFSSFLNFPWRNRACSLLEAVAFFSILNKLTFCLSLIGDCVNKDENKMFFSFFKVQWNKCHFSSVCNWNWFSNFWKSRIEINSASESVAYYAVLFLNSQPILLAFSIAFFDICFLTHCTAIDSNVLQLHAGRDFTAELPTKNWTSNLALFCPTKH